jgi:hypothetical protein
MAITYELPPLAAEILKTLKETYDRRGPSAFDEDAAQAFHVIGSIIAQVCGRERLAEAVETLEISLEMEGTGGKSEFSRLTSLH